jgi:hypothetical protein
MGDIRNIYKISVGIPEGKRSLGSPTCRWVIILEWTLEGNRVGRC